MKRFNAHPCRTSARNIVVADDHQVVAEGVAHLLSGVADVVTLVRTGEQLLDSLRSAEPDLVIAEISLPGLDGVEAMKLARSEGYSVPFLFLTAFQDPAHAAVCIRAGARGFVSKAADREELLQAIDSVLTGQTYVPKGLFDGSGTTVEVDGRKLTHAQLVVLAGVGRGLRAREIARWMGLSTRTVESHKYLIMQTLGVRGTLELVARARKEGLIEA